MLVGVASGDGPADIEYIASKMRELRIFADENGKMNRSLAEAGGGSCSSSPVHADGRRQAGAVVRRSTAPRHPIARESTFEALLARLRAGGPVETGVFQAHMDVELINDGPVTVLLDSRRAF